jgi:hypothetical protein
MSKQAHSTVGAHELVGGLVVTEFKRPGRVGRFSKAFSEATLSSLSCRRGDDHDPYPAHVFRETEGLGHWELKFNLRIPRPR